MLSGSELLRRSARWAPRRAMKAFGRPVALAFHGVVRRIVDARIEVNQHEFDQFRALATTLRDEFDVLPMSELDDALANPRRHARTVFLTSDDGYLNTLTQVADILEDLKLPWTLFVSTHHIETGEPNPLFIARLFICFAPNGSYTLPHLPEPFELGCDRTTAMPGFIGALRGLDQKKVREAIAAMKSVFSQTRLDELVEQFPSEKFLSWQDVEVLARRGVEIGAHADFHWALGVGESVDTIDEQVRRPYALISKHVGSCRYFAYPFGNVGDVSSIAWKRVRDAGYSHAFTTLTASLDGSRNAWLLPRYALMAREPHLASLLPMLRAGNGRLADWQKQLAA